MIYRKLWQVLKHNYSNSEQIMYRHLFYKPNLKHQDSLLWTQVSWAFLRWHKTMRLPGWMGFPVRTACSMTSRFSVTVSSSHECFFSNLAHSFSIAFRAPSIFMALSRGTGLWTRANHSSDNPLAATLSRWAAWRSGLFLGVWLMLPGTCVAKAWEQSFQWQCWQV